MNSWNRAPLHAVNFCERNNLRPQGRTGRAHTGCADGAVPESVCQAARERGRLGDRPPRNNPRFVVTNLPQAPAHVYSLYRERGDVENRTKELHYGLGLDRTSCSAFRANAFRVLPTAAAYVLLRALRRHLAATACRVGQVSTLRERLLKLRTRVTVSARRIVLHLPSAFPWLAAWRAVALALGGRTG